MLWHVADEIPISLPKAHNDKSIFMKSSLNGAIFSSVLLVDGCPECSASSVVVSLLLDLENKKMIEFCSLFPF
jgi:hypothetical protein